MALKKSTSTVYGVEVVDAYHRVESVIVNSKNVISFAVRSYNDPSLPFFQETQYSCAYVLEGKNPIAQAYEHLKTLPEFAGAVDC